MRLITAWSSVSRNSRGRGLPAWARGVTVPHSTNPKPAATAWAGSVLDDDKASVPLQLAAIARGDPAQLAGDIDIQVGEDREAVVFRFVVVGQEEIETKLGKLQTVRLSRPPKEGSYRSRLDVWLAPGRGWYPVQIRNTEANGAVTTQTVNNIALTDTGK